MGFELLPRAIPGAAFHDDNFQGRLRLRQQALHEAIVRMRFVLHRCDVADGRQCVLRLDTGIVSKPAEASRHRLRA